MTSLKYVNVYIARYPRYCSLAIAGRFQPTSKLSCMHGNLNLCYFLYFFLWILPVYDCGCLTCLGSVIFTDALKSFYKKDVKEKTKRPIAATKHKTRKVWRKLYLQ